ncbi:MAG: anti-sigma factor family protein [Candidatus Acidiferrales bacterium]
MNQKQEKPTACKEYESLLEDQLEGQLNPVSQSRVAAHLAACPACREAFEDARTGSELLRLSHQPTADPGEFFPGRVMALIRAEEKARAGSFWRPLETLAWKLSLSAALALVLLTGYEMVSLVHLQSAPAARQFEMRELFPDPVQQPTGRDDVLVAIAEKNHAE